MKSRFSSAAMLALVLGVNAAAAPVWAEMFIKIDGVQGESHSLPIAQFPGNSFSRPQLRQFHGEGITTAADLIAADPALVGRIMGLNPRQARMMQRHLRESMSSR